MMPDAFQRCPVRGKAAMAKKMKHLKFHLNTRKNNFTLRVAEQCNRLPGGGVESPLETFQTHLLWFVTVSPASGNGTG